MAESDVLRIVAAQDLSKQAQAVLDRIIAERDALQARVDQLMWEFTPDEMTGPQKDRWAAAQICSEADASAKAPTP